MMKSMKSSANMCSRSTLLFSQILKNVKCFRQMLPVRRKYGKLCVLMGPFVKLSCDSKLVIQEPDPSKLTREYLIKSASVTTADNALILYTQAGLALQQADIEYKEALLALSFLLEFKLTVLGNQQEEARIWDLILQGRSLVNDTRKRRDDLEILFRRTEALVSTAAEITFMAGVDVVGSSAGDRLHKMEQMIREEKERCQQAERKLQETEVKVINVEGKYAEEHADELEEERRHLLQDLQKSSSQADETGTKNEKAKEIEVVDIIGTLDETKADNAAEEL